MRSRTKHIFLVAWLCCLTAFLTSCGSDAVNADEGEGQTVMSFVMRAPQANGASGNGEYEEGTANENAIGMDDADYRILFFDSSNKYLGRCYGAFTAMNSSEYTEYRFSGVVPETLLARATLKDGKYTAAFKIVVLANWGAYDDGALTVGESTIEDLCNAEWAQFSWDENSTQEIINGKKRIPFFGVRGFSGIEFAKGKTTSLGSYPITLLRAVAKVEVSKEDTEENKDYELKSVSLDNYNAKGFCAPLVDDRDDYDHDYIWSMDFVRSLHLVGNQEQKSTLAFYHDEETDKWVAYIPEYRNLEEDGITARNDGLLSAIKVRFDFQVEKDKEFTVFFADYYENSNVVKEYLNIERNNLYRYVINFAKGKIKVVTGDWVQVYDNDYYFDL